MNFLFLAAPVVAAVLLIAAEIMNHRQAFPKFDIFLAAGTAAPAAASTAAGMSGKPVSLFTAPLVEFMFHGLPVFLTIPDCLALIASVIMVVRFVAWALSPIRGRKGGADD